MAARRRDEAEMCRLRAQLFRETRTAGAGPVVPLSFAEGAELFVRSFGSVTGLHQAQTERLGSRACLSFAVCKRLRA